MNCRKSATVTVSTFRYLFKLIIYRLLMSLVTIGLAVAIILPLISYILHSQELKTLLTTGKDLFSNLFRGKDLSPFGEKLVEDVSSLWLLIISKKINLVFVFLGIIVLSFANVFLRGLASYVYGIAVNDYMSTLSDFGFFHCFFRNLKSACLYQLLYALIKIVYYVAAIALLFFLFTEMLAAISLVAFPLTYLFAILLFALFHTYFCGMLPATVVGEKKVGEALRHSFRQVKDKKKFSTVFASQIYFIVCSTVLVSAFGLFTFGLGFFVMPIVCNMWAVSLSFAHYYAFNDKKFYLHYDNIVVPKALRKEESLLNQMDL